MQQLKQVIRESDHIQVLSDDKIGVLINGIAEETAQNIYQRIKAILNGSTDEIKVFLRKAR